MGSDHEILEYFTIKRVLLPEFARKKVPFVRRCLKLAGYYFHVTQCFRVVILRHLRLATGYTEIVL